MKEAKKYKNKVNRPFSELEFEVKAFLVDGRINGYVLRAFDGKPFLVKYKEPLIKEGRLNSLVIWLVDPCASKKDIVGPSYFSETFSHFFGASGNASDYLELDDGGLVVAEIELEADESGLLHLIADLNYKHIHEAVLNKYYGTHQGEYDFIGRSMVGIAGKVLKEAYGIKFLGVKTDKTRGFYWEIFDRKPENPAISIITGQLMNIKDIRERREIRNNFYINIVKKIASRRFDPYMTSDGDTSTYDAWERHCDQILDIFSDNESLLIRLLDKAGDAKAIEAKEFVKQTMVKYRSSNIEWFTSISYAMHRLIEVNRS